MQVGATVDEQIIQIANFSEPSPWESHRRPAQHGSHSYRRPKTAASGRNAARVEGPGQWSVAHCSDVSSEKLAENPSLNMPPPSRRIVLVSCGMPGRAIMLALAAAHPVRCHTTQERLLCPPSTTRMTRYRWNSAMTNMRLSASLLMTQKQR